MVSGYKQGPSGSSLGLRLPQPLGTTIQLGLSCLPAPCSPADAAPFGCSKEEAEQEIAAQTTCHMVPEVGQSSSCCSLLLAGSFGGGLKGTLLLPLPPAQLAFCPNPGHPDPRQMVLLQRQPHEPNPQLYCEKL